MRLAGLQQVLTRINSIEARFAVKSGMDFSQNLTAAINSSEYNTKPHTAAKSSDSFQVEQIVRAAAVKHGVKPELALAVARSESNFSQQAVSPVGAIGVMQLMPDTAKELGVRNIYDVQENVDGGVRYLKKLLLTFKDEKLAVAAYNAGPEAVNRFRGIPPYAETQQYVENVFRNMSS